MASLALSLGLALAGTAEGPLDRLVGNWESLETVKQGDGKDLTLRLKGTNAWVFEGKLLEIRETYTIDGRTEPGANHILLRQGRDQTVLGWWHTPEGEGAMTLRGTYDAEGMTLERSDKRLRIVYRWDGKDAYDARLQIRRTESDPYEDRTIARYTRKR